MDYLRLKKNGDFLKLFKKGKRVYSRSLTVIYSPSPVMRMGIAVSKKNGKAVKRNRVKRLVRAAFRNGEGKLSGNYSMVIIPKPAESYSYKEIEKSLFTCFLKMTK